MKDHKKQTLSHFEDQASTGKWESLYTGKSYNYITRREEVLKMVSGLEYESVVDLGSGTGDYASYFTKNTKEYLGIDNSVEMVLSAQKRCPDAVFREGDVENLSVSSEVFDLSLAIGLIEYFPQPTKVIQEVHRILKTGGYFLVQAPHKSVIWNIEHVTFALLTPVIALRSYIKKRPVIYHGAYTESSLRALIEPSGFQYCETRYCNYRMVPWPFSDFSYRLEKNISEKITDAENRSRFKSLAANIIILFRKK